jgi:catechol 2,3-dioxygenase-like lactoylglutathione lyase family enzyme
METPEEKLLRMVGFVSTARPEAAKKFYGDTLGFRFLRDDGYALVFDANGTLLRVGKAQTHTPTQGTVCGWEVRDLDAVVPAGIVTFPTGDKVAWFRDPDGNVLGLSQHAQAIA